MQTTDTKTQILDVAQDLIQRLGVNGMSYQDISAVVGIRKASIHTHFPRKEDLVTALLIRYRERFLRIVDGILASGDEPEVKLRRYCGLYAATLSSGNQNKVCLYAMLGAELNVLNSPLVAQIQQFYRDNETRLAQMLTEGKQRGDFRFPGEVDTMATLVFGLLEGEMLIARAHGGAERFHQVVEQLLRLVKG